MKIGELVRKQEQENAKPSWALTPQEQQRKEEAEMDELIDFFAP
jgi:hypothetical protein